MNSRITNYIRPRFYSKLAVIGLITVGFLFLILFWHPNLNTLAADNLLTQPGLGSNTNRDDQSVLLPVPLSQSMDNIGPHGGYSALTDGCAVCHRGHTAPGRDLTAFWPEETLCFTCHSTEGDAEGDILSLFLSFPNTETAFFNHPVMQVEGVHDTPLLDEEEDLSARHIECVDCHNPHDVSTVDQTAPAVSGKLAGVAGVEPIFSGPGSPVGFTRFSQVEYEYQVCFRCHSSYTDLPSYLPDGWSGSQVVSNGLPKLTNPEPEQVQDSRDLAQEFNPTQASYHPVLAPGQNQMIHPESFMVSWSVGSYTYCSDCHSTQLDSYQSDGPHAGQLHILREASPYVTVNTGGRSRLTGAEICFNCHRAETYLTGDDPVEYTNFRRNTRNLHRDHTNNASCYMCHDTHGSEQRHLLNLDTSLNDQNPELLVFLPGYDQQPTNSQSFWQISPDGNDKTCFIECHNQNHDRRGWTYPNYVEE